jgi:hypothetical protein
MTYVNFRGEEIGLIDHGRAPKPKKDEESYHNGWRVQGIPPGELEAARESREKLDADARRAGREPQPWDEGAWLMNARRKPVRSKPYSIEAAARDCKALAERSGWLRVEIVELKKEVRAA